MSEIRVAVCVECGASSSNMDTRGREAWHALHRCTADGVTSRTEVDTVGDLPEGALDEVVGRGQFHVEMMDTASAWMRLGPDTYSIAIERCGPWWRRYSALVIRHIDGKGAVKP